MELLGIDVSANRQVKVFFEESIQLVDTLIHQTEGLPYLAPGWIDLQVNGFAGVDYCSPEAPVEEIGRSLREQFASGVTRVFPTVITGPPASMAGALRNLARAREELPEGRAMEGFHVEGPHISPEDGPRGAHPREWVRPPDLDEYKRWQEAADGNVKLVTLAPEWPGAVPYIERLVSEGVAVSIGHARPSPEQIDAAVEAGATLCTHLGNGADFMMRRHPNYLWDQLAEDRLAAGFIVDGIHLPPAFLKVALRAKGFDRSVLVTDAVMPAGCKPGPYWLGTVAVELHPGDRVTLAGNDRLAGSALRMDRAVANVMRLAGVSLVQAVAMATRNPARAGRIAGRQKGIAAGDRADFVEFRMEDDSLIVEHTWLDGKVVFSRN